MTVKPAEGGGGGAVGMDLDHSKTVVLFRNGDRNSPGRKFVINPRRIRTMDYLLNEVTASLRPTFGAVRRLVTPSHGHRVPDLQHIQPDCTYVVAGNEPFVKLSYADLLSPKLQYKPYMKTYGDDSVFNAFAFKQKFDPVRHSRIQKSARYNRGAKEPVVIS